MLRIYLVGLEGRAYHLHDLYLDVDNPNSSLIYCAKYRLSTLYLSLTLNSSFSNIARI